MPKEATLILLTVAAGPLYAIAQSCTMKALGTLKRGQPLNLVDLVGPMMWSVVVTSLISALLYLAARDSGPQVVVSAGLVAALLVVGAHWQARRQGLQATQDAARVQELGRVANQDPLTGLPNRRAYREAVAHAIAAARGNPEHRLAVMYLDFDRFKRINDTLGHQAGDELLVAASRRMQQQLRVSDVVARLGGDEFAVLVNPLGTEGQALALATRLLDALEQPYSLASRQVTSRASIGIAFGGGPDPKGCDDLLHEADMAMFDAKSAGRGCFRVSSTATPRLKA